MAVLKNQINLHKFTAPTADTILVGAGIGNTDTAGNTDTGGKEGGENNKTIIFHNENLEVEFTASQNEALERLTTMQNTAKRRLKTINEILKWVEQAEGNHKHIITTEVFCNQFRGIALKIKRLIEDVEEETGLGLCLDTESLTSSIYDIINDAANEAEDVFDANHAADDANDGK